MNNELIRNINEYLQKLGLDFIYIIDNNIIKINIYKETNNNK